MTVAPVLRAFAFAAAFALFGCGGGGGGGGGATPLPPTITAQPADVSVPAGAGATFSVTANGDAPLAYQWKRDGVVIAGATAASFSLAATVIGDDGARFTVDVSNLAGTLGSRAATLGVTAIVRTWGPAVQISSGDPLHTPGGPQVAMDAVGNAIGVWQEAVGLSVRNAVWASRLVAGGGWSPAAPIDDTVGNSAPPQLAMSPAGLAVASFVQSIANTGDALRLRARRFDGTAWASLDRVDVLDATLDVDHRVAVAADGAATLAFNQSDNLTGRRATVAQSPAAGPWSTPEVLGASGSYLPQVAVAANGDAVMAWLVADTSSTRSLWASRRLGPTWSAPVRVVAAGREMAGLRLRADAAGNAIAVWQERPATRNEVHAARLAAATGAWSAPVLLNDGAFHAQEPELAMGAAGHTVVVWSESGDSGAGTGLVANRCTSAAAAWQGPARVQPAGASPGQSARLALGGSGNAIAVWLQGAPGRATRLELWSADFDAATERWSTPEKLMTDPVAYAAGGDTQAPAVAINAEGAAVVTWFQRTDTPFTLGIWARTRPR